MNRINIPNKDKIVTGVDHAIIDPIEIETFSAKDHAPSRFWQAVRVFAWLTILYFAVQGVVFLINH